MRFFESYAPDTTQRSLRGVTIDLIETAGGSTD